MSIILAKPPRDISICVSKNAQGDGYKIRPSRVWVPILAKMEHATSPHPSLDPSLEAYKTTRGVEVVQTEPEYVQQFS